MRVAARTWLSIAGFVVLAAGPIAFSYPFLLAWNHGGVSVNPYSVWMPVDLFVALLIGCTGFIPLRFRISTKILMLIFYVPAVAFSLLV